MPKRTESSAAILGSEGGEVVQILHAVMLAGAPYTLLRRGAVYIHPTLAEVSGP